jgi:outer membrane protein TolC
MWLTVTATSSSLLEMGRNCQRRRGGCRRAKADVAARGLVATIVQDYYGLVAAQRKVLSAQEGLREAQQFLDITQRQEAGGEVAHSDVVKARIQVSQRGRDAQDAELAALKSRLGLSVLVFPDFRDTFIVADDLQTIGPLLPLDDMKAKARPTAEVRAAEASLQQETSGTKPGRRPAVGVVRLFLRHQRQPVRDPRSGGQPAAQVGRGPAQRAALGLGAAQSKLKQAHLREQAAKADSPWRSAAGPASARFTARRNRARPVASLANRLTSRPKACG